MADESEAEEEESHIGRTTPEAGLYAKICDFWAAESVPLTPWPPEVEKQASMVKGAGVGGLGSKVAQKGTIAAFEGSKTGT